MDLDWTEEQVVLRDMVRQFALPIEITPAETVRAADGLALSSRNAYLSAQERREAPRLYALLRQAHDEVVGGALFVVDPESGWRVPTTWSRIPISSTSRSCVSPRRFTRVEASVSTVVPPTSRFSALPDPPIVASTPSIDADSSCPLSSSSSSSFTLVL